MGAGRPRKDNVLAFLQGSRQRAGHGPDAPAVPADPVEPPADITPEQRAVWDVHAPDALRVGTLTATFARSFVWLVCEPIVRYNSLVEKLNAEGWTYLKETEFGAEPKKHPLVTDLQNWQRRVEAGLAHFGLAPMGKPAISAAKPQSRVDAFKASMTGGGE
jgi:hypothetical protein